jgi:1-deoxy-D-xylulose-5-phosphate synthase
MITDTLKDKSIAELEEIAQKLRDKIIDVVSQKGGHFSSPLGAVELTIGMHRVFDAKSDPLIFDVSHQAYPHKLLTDRWDNFHTLRQFGGISGFTKPKESEYDYFVAGHSSTSISLAVGSAKVISLKGEDRTPVVMIGDGSVSNGMIYEALNELGDRKYPVVIILNDNEMSISKPIGAISKHLSKLLAGKFYQGLKDKIDKMLTSHPDLKYLAKRFDESMRLITPGMLFEEMGIDYIGPIDGHNIEEIIDTLEIAKNLGKPVIVHARTIKGKGYEPAEGRFEKWHGVGAFDKESGKFITKTAPKSATKVYSDALMDLAENNCKVAGLTAAMPSGTGLDKLIEKFPKRFWDVAIAEGHAVTSAGAMAKEGMIPFVTIYSTFLQRSIDQIIHDVCLMNLSVVFAIDRAGIVGADGETHNGTFDISYLRFIPNMTLFAPRDNGTLIEAVNFAPTLKSPCAFRYARGAFDELDFEPTKFELGKAELLQSGDESNDILFIGYGAGVSKAIKTAKLLDKKVSILDLRFVKPLDIDMLSTLAQTNSKWYVFSDSSKQGGVGSAILEALNEAKISNIELTTFEYEDSFIQHGDSKEVEKSLGLLPEQLAQKISKEI